MQDPVTGKLIPKEKYVRRSDNTSATIMGDIEPFTSPITGAVITSRSALRQHNSDHGVTDSRDYSGDYLLARSNRRVAEAKGQTKAARAERIELIKRALDE